MNYTIKKDEFISILVDCKGYSEAEAEEIATEYRNNLGLWLSDLGGDNKSLEEAKAFLS